MKKYLLLYLLLLNCIFANEKENLFEILDTGNIEYMDAAIGDCSDSEGDSYFPNNKNNKNYEIAELLIEKGANVNAKSEIGTALKNTIGANGEGKAYKMAKLLIEKGCSLDNVNGMVSASYLIRLVGSDGFINLKLPSKYKIDYSDKIHSKEQYFNTALVKAISDKDISLIKYLIENGADINITNENGDTALLEAIKTKNLEILEYILSQNPKFNIINKQGADIFIKASGEKKILELLIKYSLENCIINCNR